MRFEPRPYQQRTVDEWIKAFSVDCSPVIAVPTAGGKTVIMGEFVSRWLEKNPDENILVLSHTQEILKQDFDALLEYIPKDKLGLYSAGLKSKQIRQVTVAGIQSVYRRPEEFKHFGLAIIDEVHSVNHEDDGMYRKFLKEVGCKVTGMSATVFRMGHGYIYEGKDALFDTLAYDLTSVDNFNKLVQDGYLTRLISKATEFELDSSDVKKTAGEYNLKDLALKHDRNYVTKQAVAETVKFGKNYKKWLIFAIDTGHANSIALELVSLGIDTEELHTNMTGDRDEVIERFKTGDTRALVSVGMVTTGFDAPNVDLIVFLRPTLSTVLYVQMAGRGLRTFPGKEHCLLLDFAGNISKLGPINNPVIPHKTWRGSGSGKGDPQVKTCPKCKCHNPLKASVCEVCKYEFTFFSKLNMQADFGAQVVQAYGGASEWKHVDSVFYQIHKKIGKPDSLKVSYKCGINIYTEWVCLNHQNYAKYKADAWVEKRDPTCNIFETHHVFHRRDKLKKPKSILIKRNDRYINIIGADFGDEDEL